MRRARLVAAFGLAAAAIFSGCRRPTDGAGTRCDTDAGCPDGQFCNRGGVCQAIAGCQSNADCAGKDSTYCDVSSGHCLKAPAQMLGSECGLASHCPYGTICQDGSCVPGCFDDGDCPLGQLCLEGQC